MLSPGTGSGTTPAAAAGPTTLVTSKQSIAATHTAETGTRLASVTDSATIAAATSSPTTVTASMRSMAAQTGGVTTVPEDLANVTNVAVVTTTTVPLNTEQMTAAATGATRTSATAVQTTVASSQQSLSTSAIVSPVAVTTLSTQEAASSNAATTTTVPVRPTTATASTQSQTTSVKTTLPAPTTTSLPSSVAATTQMKSVIQTTAHITSVTSQQLSTTKTTSGAVSTSQRTTQVTIADPCGVKPCRNGGTCTRNSGSPGGYSCICVCGWKGDRCETPATLLPYGPLYDETVEFTDMDDGFSDTKKFKQPFLLDCNTETEFWINVNGFISFSRGIIDWYPEKFPITGRKMIAAFWADIDLSGTAGKVYYGAHHTSTGKYSDATETDRTVLAAAQNLIADRFGDSGFMPTSVYKITWQNVSPFPGYSNKIETTCFQMVLMSDDRTGRTYVTFQYGPNSWVRSRRNIQGYQFSLSKNYNLYTSQSANGHQLSTVKSNTDVAGVWVFRASENKCESPKSTPDFLCKQWNYNQQQIFSSYLAWRLLYLPPCPCKFSQALLDPRYYINYDEGCAILAFPLFQETVAQKCCYHRTRWSYSELISGNTLSAGSSLLYHPYYYENSYYDTDVAPKNWCCRDSNNCHLFYEVRPQDRCSRYINPWLALFFGDPHFKTLDGCEYIFNGLGEYWLIDSSASQLQGRTILAWDSNRKPVNATVFGAVAAQAVIPQSNSTNSTNMNMRSARLHVEMSADRVSGMIIRIDDHDDQSNWFVTADFTKPPNKFNGLQLTRINDSLVATFASGMALSITMRAFQLDVSFYMPDSARNKDVRGLFGNFNGNSTDELISKNGILISCNSTENDIYNIFGQSWRIEQASETLFWYNTSNGQNFETVKESGNDFVPLLDIVPSAGQIKQAEQYCKQDNIIDKSCAYDLIATGNVITANTTRGISETYMQTKSFLGNNIPTTSDPGLQNWIVQQTYSFNITTYDADNDTVQLFALKELPAGAILNQTKQNVWQFTWMPQSLQTVELIFGLNDSRGASGNSLTVSVQLCNCSGNDHGECLWGQTQNGFNATDTFQVVACKCRVLLYDGDFCENDTNPCLQFPCGGPNGSCTDIPATEIIAHNLTNGYRCTGCPVGFNVSSDKFKCEDIDECALPEQSSTCLPSAGNCSNLPGTYICQCNPGYVNKKSLQSCEDVNECLNGDNLCDQICINTPGGYNCSCHDGYDQANATACILQKNSTCEALGCDHFCINSTICGCRFGYELVNETHCADIDECHDDARGLNLCMPKSISQCKNYPGTYTCECPATGYIMLPDQLTCEECMEGTWGANCNETCRCTAGDYQNCSKSIGCTKCDDDGWTGPNCDVDIDECELKAGICGDHANCSNTNGSFLCTCDSWYQRLSESCQLLDACIFQANGSDSGVRCSGHGACINGSAENHPGGFACACSPGWSGMNCETELDGCVPNPCNHSAPCFNSLGNPVCDCPTGYYGVLCQWVIPIDAANDNASASFNYTEYNITIAPFTATTLIESTVTQTFSAVAATAQTTATGTLQTQTGAGTMQATQSEGTAVTQTAVTAGQTVSAVAATGTAPSTSGGTIQPQTGTTATQGAQTASAAAATGTSQMNAGVTVQPQTGTQTASAITAATGTTQTIAEVTVQPQTGTAATQGAQTASATAGTGTSQTNAGPITGSTVIATTTGGVTSSLSSGPAVTATSEPATTTGNTKDVVPIIAGTVAGVAAGVAGVFAIGFAVRYCLRGSGAAARTVPRKVVDAELAPTRFIRRPQLPIEPARPARLRWYPAYGPQSRVFAMPPPQSRPVVQPYNRPLYSQVRTPYRDPIAPQRMQPVFSAPYGARTSALSGTRMQRMPHDVRWMADTASVTPVMNRPQQVDWTLMNEFRARNAARLQPLREPVVAQRPQGPQVFRDYPYTSRGSGLVVQNRAVPVAAQPTDNVPTVQSSATRPPIWQWHS